MTRLTMACLVVTALAAGCGGQKDASSARKADQSPIAGAEQAYAAAGWKPGDATGWEQHMRARTQNQNEYSRTQGR